MADTLLAAVLVLGAIGLVNLFLLLGLTHRVREQSTLIAAATNGLLNPEPVMLESGGRVGAFTSETTDGGRVSEADLVGDSLVAFVTPTCPACAESLPAFLLRAEGYASRDRVLAVVMSAPEEAVDLVDQLASVARVVVEPLYGTVGTAFGVTGYPAFAVLQDDLVVASHFGLDKIPDQNAA